MLTHPSDVTSFVPTSLVRMSFARIVRFSKVRLDIYHNITFEPMTFMLMTFQPMMFVLMTFEPVTFRLMTFEQMTFGLRAFNQLPFVLMT